jgi:hypothetical protein
MKTVLLDLSKPPAEGKKSRWQAPLTVQEAATDWIKNADLEVAHIHACIDREIQAFQALKNKIIASTSKTRTPEDLKRPPEIVVSASLFSHIHQPNPVASSTTSPSSKNDEKDSDLPRLK